MLDTISYFIGDKIVVVSFSMFICTRLWDLFFPGLPLLDAVLRSMEDRYTLAFARRTMSTTKSIQKLG